MVFCKSLQIFKRERIDKDFGIEIASKKTGEYILSLLILLLIIKNSCVCLTFPLFNRERWTI